jgi:hypothetical protein
VHLQLVYSKAPRQVAIPWANLSPASAGGTPSLRRFARRIPDKSGNLTVPAIARILRGCTASYLPASKYGKLDGVACQVGSLAVAQLCGRPARLAQHSLASRRSRCFCRKLSAIDTAFAAEILALRRRGDGKNSGCRRPDPLQIGRSRWEGDARLRTMNPCLALRS